MSATSSLKGKSRMDRKIVSISSKRQITIPQKFFEALRFADEAECVMRGNELVIRPVHFSSSGEFAENILEELVNSGLSGDELLKEFKNRQAMVRPAVEKMIEQADDVASDNGEYYTYEDIFGAED